MKFKLKPKIVEAWQFQPDKAIPAWVARHVHRLGIENPNERSLKDYHGILHIVEPGDYIVRCETFGGVNPPIPAVQFEEHYEPV